MKSASASVRRRFLNIGQACLLRGGIGIIRGKTPDITISHMSVSIQKIGSLFVLPSPHRSDDALYYILFEP